MAVNLRWLSPLALPRTLLGTRRFTMPRQFARTKVLRPADFAAEMESEGFNPVQGLLDQFRKLYLGLDQQLGGSGAVVICSPNLREGRSLIAANLAQVLVADTRRAVTLVDLDLRHPSLATLLEVPDGPGAVELAHGARLDEVLAPTSLPGLELIRAGAAVENPVALLQSGFLPRLFAELAGRRRFVIVDTPAVNSASDARLVAGHVAGIVTVVKLHQTKRVQLAHYYQRLRGQRFLGAVCNYDEYWIPNWLYRFL